MKFWKESNGKSTVAQRGVEQTSEIIKILIKIIKRLQPFVT